MKPISDKLIENSMDAHLLLLNYLVFMFLLITVWNRVNIDHVEVDDTSF